MEMTVNEFFETISAVTKRVDVFDRGEALIARWDNGQGMRSWHGRDFGECEVWLIKATGNGEFDVFVYDAEINYEDKEYWEEWEGDGLRLEYVRPSEQK